MQIRNEEFQQKDIKIEGLENNLIELEKACYNEKLKVESANLEKEELKRKFLNDFDELKVIKYFHLIQQYYFVKYLIKLFRIIKAKTKKY